MKLSLHCFLVSVCVLVAVENSLQVSTPESRFYVAAVVDYNPAVSDVSYLETFQKNVDLYTNLIEAAANEQNNADIIVFPECGLATLNTTIYSEVPSPSSGIVPCDATGDKYDKLSRISCAARRHHIYVVINLYEGFYCKNGTTSDYDEPCPETELIKYNTDVVFDREGKVVARYRKFHLFGEDASTPPKADLVTFKTDFGVTFGLFTCFDIMFEEPAIQLVKEKNITDIIFPTAWFSELPFLTAVQTQAAWANRMNVNLLASGYNEPSVGSGGSGIYSGRGGPFKVVMPSTASTNLLVSSVPKVPGIIVGHLPLNDVASPPPGMFMKQDNLAPYKSHLLDPAGLNAQQEVVCDGSFCCHFEVAGATGEGVPYLYRLVAFNGVRTFDGVATGGLQVCALVFCTDASLSSCGLSSSAETNVTAAEFQHLSIRGDFKKSGVQFPNTLVEGYLPLFSDHFVLSQLSDDQDVVTLEMKLLKKASVLTFGIYGRDFTRDGEDATSSGAINPITALGCTLILILKLGFTNMSF